MCKVQIDNTSQHKYSFQESSDYQSCHDPVQVAATLDLLRAEDKARLTAVIQDKVEEIMDMLVAKVSCVGFCNHFWWDSVLIKQT